MVAKCLYISQSNQLQSGRVATNFRLVFQISSFRKDWTNHLANPAQLVQFRPVASLYQSGNWTLKHYLCSLIIRPR